jgi:hypothetical protein
LWSSSSRGDSLVFQHPGSPSCPQQACPSATLRQMLRVNFISFSGHGIGWSKLVKMSESEGRFMSIIQVKKIGFFINSEGYYI